MKYKVIISGSDRKIIVDAKDSNQAKRKACKAFCIKISDRWCGLKGMHASRV